MDRNTYNAHCSGKDLLGYEWKAHFQISNNVHYNYPNHLSNNKYNGLDWTSSYDWNHTAYYLQLLLENNIVGEVIGVPEQVLYKTPSDGLCGKTDEDSLGFAYATLDKYLRTGICEDPEIQALIDKKHLQNKLRHFLRNLIP